MPSISCTWYRCFGLAPYTKRYTKFEYPEHEAPSATARLVKTPVATTPTSAGHSACFGGTSHMLSVMSSRELITQDNGKLV